MAFTGGSLFPHQVEALTWTGERNRIALFMEMRLGKTRIVIAWCNKRAARKILVVAPLTVLGSWQEELHAVGESPPTVLRNKKSHTRTLPRTKWSLINYDLLRTSPHIVELDWDAVILDESTRIRNPKAQITKVLNGGVVKRKLRASKTRPAGMQTIKLPGCRAPFRAILSGRPAPESPMDYFEQFRFLHGGFCYVRTFWAFRDRYFQHPMFALWEWAPKPGTRDIIKTEIRKKAYILSRKEAGIGSRKVYEKRVVVMGSELRKSYETAEREFVLDHPELEEGKTTNWPMVMSMWLGRMAGGFVDEKYVDPAKMNELMELLTGELKGEKAVVWFRFNAEVEQAYQLLKKKKIQCAVITGATPYQVRDLMRKRLRDEPEGNSFVLLCQVKCARYGIDLAAADVAIYYSNSYSLEERAQSEDRIVHPKKSVPLLYIDLINENTVDEDVVKALREKHTQSAFFLQALAKNFSMRIKKKER